MPFTPDQDPAQEPPNVPGFRSWRAVYVFVLLAFAAMVAALAAFSRYYA